MLYSTVFSTKTKEGANQTEIATLLTEDGYANTGLTFQWYIWCLYIPPLPNSVPCEYSSLHGERIGKSRRFRFFRKTVFQNSPFLLGFQNCRARSSRCCGLAFTQVKKHLTWLLCSGTILDRLRLPEAPLHAFGRTLWAALALKSPVGEWPCTCVCVCMYVYN